MKELSYTRWILTYCFLFFITPYTYAAEDALEDLSCLEYEYDEPDHEPASNILAEQWFDALNANNIEAMKACIEKGIDVNIRDKYNTNDLLINTTALLIAVYNNNQEIVRLLLQNPRVDVNVFHEEVKTPFIRAILNRNEAISAMLLTREDLDPNLQDRDCSPLALAVSQNALNTLILLITRTQTDINIQTQEGITPLMCAVYFNNKEAMEILLSSPQININLQMKNGLTALALAQDFKFEEGIAILNSFDASLNTTNE